MSDAAVAIGNLTVQVDIDASPERVWDGLTQSIGDWWPAEFYSGGESDSRTMQLELLPGGRMVETWDDGGGTLWATIVSFTPAESLQVVGYLFPGWGGPAQWYGTWRLEKVRSRTRLTFEESTVGPVTEQAQGQKGEGCQFLSVCLKAFVENKPAPDWPE